MRNLLECVRDIDYPALLHYDADVRVAVIQIIDDKKLLDLLKSLCNSSDISGDLYKSSLLIYDTEKDAKCSVGWGDYIIIRDISHLQIVRVISKEIAEDILMLLVGDYKPLIADRLLKEFINKTNNPEKIIGIRLSKVISREGFTVEEISRWTNYSIEVIESYLHANGKYEASILLDICNAIDLSFEALLRIPAEKENKDSIPYINPTTSEDNLNLISSAISDDLVQKQAEVIKQFWNPGTSNFDKNIKTSLALIEELNDLRAYVKKQMPPSYFRQEDKTEAELIVEFVKEQLRVKD